jgi:hypothetical protein
MRVEIRKLDPGVWVRPRRRGYLFGCCDCGLVHRVDFRVVEGRAEFRLYRAEAATKRLRRRMRARRKPG